jgi:1,4-dihydroxy-2-naphthoate octaprenyltransferase
MGGLESLNVCLRIVRPHIVTGGFLGYSLGTLLALVRGGAFSPSAFALGYAIVFFGDLSTHFSNDCYDLELDRNAPSKTFGGRNVLVDHPEARRLAMVLALTFSAISVSLAFSMVNLLGHPPILLALAAFTNVLGWLYSAPPVRLNARCLGEATIAFGTGLAVPAVGYIVTSGLVDQLFLAFSAPLVLYGLILGMSLEMPDLEVDRVGGKRNLVVWLGRRPVALLTFLTSVAATALFTLYSVVDFGRFWALPVLSAAPIVASSMGLLRRPHDHADADRLSALNISALFIFLVALDGYLLTSLL